MALGLFIWGKISRGLNKSGTARINVHACNQNAETKISQGLKLLQNKPRLIQELIVYTSCSRLITTRNSYRYNTFSDLSFA